MWAGLGSLGYYINVTTLACKLLSGSAGTLVKISISRNGGHDFGSKVKDPFQYVFQPTIKSTHAMFGWESGGIMLTIKSPGFQPGGYSQKYLAYLEMPKYRFYHINQIKKLYANLQKVK